MVTTISISRHSYLYGSSNAAALGFVAAVVCEPLLVGFCFWCGDLLLGVTCHQGLTLSD